MQNIFPPFVTIPNTYPLPVPNVQLGTTTYPTNSWFENAIANNIPDTNRNGQALPWYWAPAYNNSTLNLQYLGCDAFSNTFASGNLIIQEAFGSDITVGTSNPTSLNMTAIDDFTVEFVQTSAAGNVKAWPMRGSPST